MELSAQSFSDSSLPFPFNYNQSSGMFLNTTANFNKLVIYDPLTNSYLIQDKIGTLDLGPPIIMDFLEYQQYSQKKIIDDYWNLRSKVAA